MHGNGSDRSAYLGGIRFYVGNPDVTPNNAYHHVPNVVVHARVRDEHLAPNPYRWAPISARTLMGRGRVAVFSFPAAFSPTCSDEHLPAIEATYDRFEAAGCRAMFAVSVNDAFVMHRWGEALGIEKVHLVPDGNGDFTRRMGMLVSRRGLGYGFRSWRYAFLADDGGVVAWFEEPGIGDDGGTGDDPYGATAPEAVLARLEDDR